MTPFPVCQSNYIRTFFFFFYLLMLKGKSHPHLAIMVKSLFYSLVNKQMRLLGFILEIIREELR